MAPAKVLCAPVRELSEVTVDENMHAHGSLHGTDHPELGRIVLPHSPLVFEGAQRPEIEPSLPLGARNEEVLASGSATRRRKSRHSRPPARSPEPARRRCCQRRTSPR